MGIVGGAGNILLNLEINLMNVWIVYQNSTFHFTGMSTQDFYLARELSAYRIICGLTKDYE